MDKQVKQTFYYKDQVWDGSNGNKLKFEFITKEEALSRGCFVMSVFELLPDGHPKKPKVEKVTKKVVKKAVKKVKK